MPLSTLETLSNDELFSICSFIDTKHLIDSISLIRLFSSVVYSTALWSSRGLVSSETELLVTPNFAPIQILPKIVRLNRIQSLNLSRSVPYMSFQDALLFVKREEMKQKVLCFARRRTIRGKLCYKLSSSARVLKLEADKMTHARYLSIITEIIAGNRSIVRLNLSGIRLGHSDFAKIDSSRLYQALAGDKTIRQLDLSDNNLSFWEASLILSSRTIDAVNLAGNDLSLETSPMLFNNVAYSSVTDIDLSRNELGKCTNTLTGIISQSMQVDSLYVWANTVSDGEYRTLVVAMGNGVTRRMTISHGVNVTVAGGNESTIQLI